MTRLLDRVLVAAAFAFLIASTTFVRAGAPPDSFADLVQKLSPAVVNISTTQYVSAKKGADPDAQSARPWEQGLQDDLESQKEKSEDKSAKKRMSLGSGFVIDKAGYIVTNNHVVEGADDVSVIFDDDTVLKARVVGRDEKVDVALLKVETKKDLPVVVWGNSSQIRVGDWVLAIGNPFGLSGTVTAGIVSARARDIKGGQYDDYIQTDAAINRGNSGGPLFNTKGEVIGINTAIFSPSGGSVGLGFAAATNLVRPVIEDLRKYGHARRHWIGLRLQSVTDDIALSLALGKARGALVAEVLDGPARTAGFQSSDVVLTFDGQAVDKMMTLPRLVAETPIDKTVDVVVWRKSAQHTLKMKVSELKDEAKVASDDDPSIADVERTKITALGITVAEIGKSERGKYSIPENVTGLVVVEVSPTSDAAGKGLHPGDVIDEIQQMTVAGIADAEAAIQHAREAAHDVLLLRVMSGDGIRYVPIKVAG